jgi:hypothetical protein
MLLERGWGNSVFVDSSVSSLNMHYASRNIPGLLFYAQNKYDAVIHSLSYISFQSRDPMTLTYSIG